MIVSITNPRMTFPMSQLQLPVHSFFKETGLLLNAKSSALKDRNTWLMVCRSVHCTLRRLG